MREVYSQYVNATRIITRIDSLILVNLQPWFYQKIVPKSHDNTGQGNKFSDKQKNLPACPVDKLSYFLNSNAVCKFKYLFK